MEKNPTFSSKVKAPVSVIILTLNEEANIEYCLRSVYGWSDDIHVIDSFSKDNTARLAAKYTKNIYEVREAHWADLRNWAMRNLPLKYEWVLFLDADERLTDELKKEISETLKSNPEDSSFWAGGLNMEVCMGKFCGYLDTNLQSILLREMLNMPKLKEKLA